MNRKKLTSLYLAALAGGCLTFVLRLTLRRAAVGGLEPSGTWQSAAALGVLLAVIVFTVARTWKVQEDKTYQNSFPASRMGALGSWIAAALLFFHAFSALLEQPDRLTMAVELMGVVCAIALGFTGWCRYAGRRPNFLYHALLCVYFTLHMISNYRTWSAEPQMLTYMYQLLALASVAIAGYCRACFDANCGNRRMYLRFCFPAVMLCIAAAADGSRALYLAAALWLGTNPCVCAEPCDHAS